MAKFKSGEIVRDVDFIFYVVIGYHSHFMILWNVANHKMENFDILAEDELKRIGEIALADIMSGAVSLNLETNVTNNE